MTSRATLLFSAVPIRSGKAGRGVAGLAGFLLTALALAAPVSAQRPAPVVDMHLHAESSDFPVGLCLPWIRQFPPWDQDRSWEEIFLEAMAEPPCDDPIWSPVGEEAALDELLAVMERRNVTGVLSGPPELVRRWVARAPSRFIPALEFRFGRDPWTLTEMRALLESGDFQVLGEVAAQYAGVAPDAPELEPYWALAEEFGVPVMIHMGEGSVGTPFLGFTDMTRYRARLSDPYGLEEVLVRHPRLKVVVAHYGAPLVDPMIAVLGAYPQVYVDIGGMQWYYPRTFFYRHLQALVEAGYEDRILFGSDQSIWPGVLDSAIDIVREAPFLTDEQERAILYDNAARFLGFPQARIDGHYDGVDPGR